MKEYIVSVDDDDMDYEEVFIGHVRKQTELIRCEDCYFWDKEPSQTAMPEVHTCRYWRIGTTSVDYCARASRDRWLKAMPKENATALTREVNNE